MTPRELLDAFDVLAEAPNGIARLRELVLQLAVRGKLVPQDPKDEPAAAALQRVRTARAKWFEANESRPPKPPKASKASKAPPFDVPPGWSWTQLGRECLVEMGNSPPGTSYNDAGRGVPLINGPVEFSPMPLGPTRRVKFTTSPTKMCETGDLIVCVRGATTGRTNIAAFDACIGRGVALIRGWEVQEWVCLFMRYVGAELLALGKGTTFPSISYDDLAAKLFPVPPLAEQARIVARVDELMALIDRFEQARLRRESARVAFRDASLAAIRGSETAEELESAWSLVHAHFDEVLAAPGDLRMWREVTRELAVRGHLTRFDDADEDVDSTLAHVAATRGILVESKRIRRRSAPGAVDSPLFEVRDNWRWVRLGDVAYDIEGGWSPSAQPRPKEGDEWGVLKVSACSWEVFLPEENKALMPGTEPRTEFEVKAGDLLISRANTRELVARSVLVSAPCPSRLMLSDKTLRVSPTPAVEPMFLNLANGTLAARMHYEEHATGTSSSMQNVSQETIWSVPIPLPPLGEQRRIIQVVQRLIKLLDVLETQIVESERAHGAFSWAATSFVHDAVSDSPQG